mgnify:CR=1 FL=1
MLGLGGSDEYSSLQNASEVESFIRSQGVILRSICDLIRLNKLNVATFFSYK